MHFFLPLIAEAAGTAVSVKGLVARISYHVLNPLIKIGFVIALLYFMWGIVQYLWNRNAGRIWDVNASGDKAGGGEHIVYGLIGLFIMVSAFGIMSLIKNLVGSTIVTP